MNRPAYHFEPCPYHKGRNVANHPCEVCGWEKEEGMELVSNPQVDTETGEVTGQLTLPGLPPLRRVPVVYKPYWEMTKRHFNGHEWALEEDDRLAVKVKDGIYQVTVTRRGMVG